MSMEQNKAAERRVIEELNKGNLAIIDELFAADYVYRGSAGMEAKGAEGFKQLMTTALSAITDFHMATEEMVAEGEKVVTRTTVSGTHKGDFVGIAATGKRFSFSAILIVRFVDGKEVNAFGVADMFGMLQQLGAVPPMG
jgi:steroid delta-isomerase-like uncharacterized protein